MGTNTVMFGFLVLSAIIADVQGYFMGNTSSEKCSDRFHGKCVAFDTDLVTHETSVEGCILTCQLEQTLGYCDWFIYTPKNYQSCQMFRNDFHGTLEEALDYRCYSHGIPTCQVATADHTCPAHCQPDIGCELCGSGNSNDICDFMYDINCIMDTFIPDSAYHTGMQDLLDCQRACSVDDTMTYAVWDEQDLRAPCQCYHDGGRKCSAVAAKMDIPPGGSYDKCTSGNLEMDSTTVPAPTETTTTNLIESRHRIRFQPEEETYAGIEEGTDHIHAIVDNGLGDFVDRTSFIFREGLCGTPGYISLESTLYPGKFWRHQGMDVKLHDRADDDLFKKDSCFLIVDDKCGAGSVSFYAVNYPDHLITKCGNQLRIEPETGDTCGSSDNFCWVLVNF